jgi:hypothetical protein
MHQQHRRIQSYPVGPPKTQSYRCANLHALHRFQSSSSEDRERMHSNGANSGEIPSSSLKDGDLFQRIHSGIHRTQQKYRS